MDNRCTTCENLIEFCTGCENLIEYCTCAPGLGFICDDCFETVLIIEIDFTAPAPHDDGPRR